MYIYEDVQIYKTYTYSIRVTPNSIPSIRYMGVQPFSQGKYGDREVTNEQSLFLTTYATLSVLRLQRISDVLQQSFEHERARDHSRSCPMSDDDSGFIQYLYFYVGVET